MTAYLVRRLLHAVLVLAILTLVAFMLIHLVPGDPVRIMLGAHAPPAAWPGRAALLPGPWSPAPDLGPRERSEQAGA